REILDTVDRGLGIKFGVDTLEFCLFEIQDSSHSLRQFDRVHILKERCRQQSDLLYRGCVILTELTADSVPFFLSESGFQLATMLTQDGMRPCSKTVTQHLQSFSQLVFQRT